MVPVDVFLDDGVSLAEGDVHLDGALGVPDVVNFLAGLLEEVAEDGRKVVVGHVLEGELPKLLAFVRIVLDVLPGVLVAPAVPQPHVETSIGQHEPRGLSFIVDDPGIGAVEETVLQEDRFETLPDEGVFFLDAEEGEDVAVVCGDVVSLDRVVVELAVVCEVELGLGVGRSGQR